MNSTEELIMSNLHFLVESLELEEGKANKLTDADMIKVLNITARLVEVNATSYRG